MLTEKENKEIKKAMNTMDFIRADPKERERNNTIKMKEYKKTKIATKIKEHAKT